MHMDFCSCGWAGEGFAQHHKETELEDEVHIETSPLMSLTRRLSDVK